MKNAIKIVLVLIILSFGTKGFSQNLYKVAKMNGSITAYQDANLKTHFKYYSIFKYGKERALPDDDQSAITLLYTMDPEAPSVFVYEMKVEAVLRGRFSADRAKKLLNQYSAELKANKKLMNAKEKEAELAAEKKKAEEKKKKAEEEAERKRKEAEVRKERARQDSIRKKLETSKGCLEYVIHNQFIEWAEKGEFEKTEDHCQRLQQVSEEKFRKLCSTVIKEGHYGDYGIYKYSVNVLKLSYDADAEKYNLKIQFLFEEFGSAPITNKEITVQIPMDVEHAKIVKEHKDGLEIKDVILGADRDTIKLQSFKVQLGDDWSYSVSLKVPDLILRGATILPEIKELKDVEFNYSEYYRTLFASRSAMLSEIVSLNSYVSKTIDSLNFVMKRSSYYKKLEDRADAYQFWIYFEIRNFSNRDGNIEEIVEYHNAIRQFADSLKSYDPIEHMKEYMRTKSPKAFIQVYFEENPALRTTLEKEYREYSCNFESFTDFVIQYDQGKLLESERNCREIKWQEYGQYYTSREEFDGDFDKGESAIAEHIEREKTREIRWQEYGQYYASREDFDSDFEEGESTLELQKNRELKWPEYRQYYNSKEEYNADFAKGHSVVELRKTRELKWQEYGSYYASREEFDSDFDKGESALELRKSRELKWPEYSQYYNSKEEYDTDFAKGQSVVELRKTRELKWPEYSQYYDSKEEYDADFAKGMSFVKDHMKREIWWTDYKDYYNSKDEFLADYNIGVSTVDMRKSKVLYAWNSLVKALIEVGDKANLQGARESSKPDILAVVQSYDDLTLSIVYLQKAADFLISSNKKMGKEYEKHGEYFSSKTDFVAAYFSKEYKQVLKSKK